MNYRSKLFPPAALLPALACAAVLGLYAWMAEGSRSFYTQSNPADDNYNLLVRGFRTGQLSLPVPVPPGFAALADPYDPAANASYRMPPDSLHDLSYYRGKFYLYFGVAPALVLFWPWAALSGHFLSHRLAVGIFSAIEFLAGSALMLGLKRRLFPEVGAGVAAGCVLALGLAVGAPILLQRAEFWEVAISCAGAMVMLALAAVWRSVQSTESQWGWLAAASLAYGVAIGARPSVLPGAGILLLPVALAWRPPQGESARRRRMLLTAAVVPVALCGSAWLLYNYLRFDSPWQFGERFQLAGDRQDEARHFSSAYLWFNLHAYFFAPARWCRFFPYVRGIAVSSLPPGHAPVEAPFGVLANLPILWFALASPLALRGRSNPERARVLGLLGAAGLLFAACASVLCLFYGSCWRYEMEFLPGLAILAMTGIFSAERITGSRRRWRSAVRCLWIPLLIASIGFNALEATDIHAEQLNQYGVELFNAGRALEAVDRIQTALRIKPQFPDAAHNLGDTFLAMGRLPEAEASYETRLRLEQDSFPAYYDAARVAVQLRRFEDGSRYLSEGLRLETKAYETTIQSFRPRKEIPGRLPGIAFRRSEVEFLQEELARMNFTLATVLMQLPDRTADAESHLEAALEFKPDNPAAHHYLAMLYAETGRPADAITHFERALRLEPGNAKTHYNLALLFAGLGQRADAISQLESALRLDPKYSAASEKLEGLKTFRASP